MMKSLALLMSVFLLVTFVFTDCNGQISGGNVRKEIVIIHVNDIHGKIDMFPRFKTFAGEIKQKHKNVIILSAGDLFSGNPVVDMYSDKGYPMIDIMNDIGFDATAVGNHEFDYGDSILFRRMSDAQFPFLAANINAGEKIHAGLSPSLTIEKDGLKIFILGLTQVSEDGLPDTRPENCRNFKFVKGIARAQDYCGAKNLNSAFIVLSHMGFKKDSLLALSMPEIHAIVGGHSHKTFINGRKINGVTVAQAGYYLKYAGVMTLTFIDDRLVSVHDTLYALNNNETVDSALLKKVQKYNDNPLFSKTTGNLASDLAGDNELGILISSASLMATEADFAFHNSGGIRKHELKKGPVTLKDIFELDPFSNEIMLLKMYPSQIREMITFGYNKEMKPDLISTGIQSEIYLDENNKVTGVKLILSDGSIADERKIYNVAVNSYVVSVYKFQKISSEKTGISTNDAIIALFSKEAQYNHCGIISSKIIKK